MKKLLSSMSLLLILAGALHAQMIKSLTATGGPSGFNYDTANDPYWAQFGVSGTDTGAGLVNVMSGASSAVTVSPITESGDSIDARTQSTSQIDFVYNNGTSPQSSATTITSSDDGTTPAGDISVQTGYAGESVTSSGQALTFTLTFNQAVSEGTLDVVANDYQASSTFNFTFSGNGPTQSFNDPYPVIVGNDDDVYELSFSDVPLGSVLTVTDTMSTINGGNTSISGVAFTVLDVPEPSIWALMIAGLAFLGFRLRRKSV